MERESKYCPDIFSTIQIFKRILKKQIYQIFSKIAYGGAQNRIQSARLPHICAWRGKANIARIYSLLSTYSKSNISNIFKNYVRFVIFFWTAILHGPRLRLTGKYCSEIFSTTYFSHIFILDVPKSIQNMNFQEVAVLQLFPKYAH